MVTGISVLCPTRGRPQVVREMARSAIHTAHGPIQMVFFVDDDDHETHAAITRWDKQPPPDVSFHIVGAPRGDVAMSNMWNWCAQMALQIKPRWPLMFVDDEALFHTEGWDAIFIRALAGYPDGSALVYPDDTIHGAVLGAYFTVAPTWVEIFGRLTPPMFTYGYADVWCFEVAKAADRAIYLPGVVIENRAPKLQPPDLVHQENQARAERDRPGDLYNATQPQREDDVCRLRNWIDQHRPDSFHWMHR